MNVRDCFRGTAVAFGLMLFNPLAMGASVAATTQAAAGQTALVSGTVTDETGGVMQAVTVRLFVNDATEPVGETTTDGDGRFTFEVPVGTYRVQVAAQDFQTVDQTIRATPGMEPLTLTLPLIVHAIHGSCPNGVEIVVTPIIWHHPLAGGCQFLGKEGSRTCRTISSGPATPLVARGVCAGTLQPRRLSALRAPAIR